MVAVLGSVYITRAGQTFQPHPFLPLFLSCQVKTFNEACLMVRKPALELLHYLKNTDFAHPAVRYILCILSCLPRPSEPGLSSLKCGKRRNAVFLDSGSVPFGSVFFNSKCFRWRKGNRKDPQSLPYYSFLCKTRLADTAYSRW